MDTAIFIDTSYVLALFNTRDQWHRVALEWETKISARNTPLITTEFVLTEIGDALSSTRLRSNGSRVIRALRTNDRVEVLPATSDLFESGLELFESRLDKHWGLTDCISFVIMNEFEISEALTTDDHFRQAGFNALLID